MEEREDLDRNKIDELTDMLCEACSLLNSKVMSSKLKKWYESHCESDLERINEQIKDLEEQIDRLPTKLKKKVKKRS
jgi:uncharacterized protein Yka (UPF0111/DUF47 family)